MNLKIQSSPLKQNSKLILVLSRFSERQCGYGIRCEIILLEPVNDAHGRLRVLALILNAWIVCLGDIRFNDLSIVCVVSQPLRF